jgi:uncharacterized protein YeaO (DUF488 family)
MHSTDQHEFVRLAGAANPFQAHIWQQALQEEGIRCQVLGDDLYAGIGGIPGIGAEVWVEATDELRKWFGHDPARWEQFQERYRQELREKKDAVGLLKQKGKESTVTLVYAARDEDHNGALALKRFLQAQ